MTSHIAVRTVPIDLRRSYEAHGWWDNRGLGTLVENGLGAAPDAEFVVHSASNPFVGTFGQVDLLARRLAAGLQRRGIGPADIIAFQLPNWVEAAVTFWAAAYLGAIAVPIVHFYGPREVGHILRESRADVFVTAARFGRMVHDPTISAGVPIVAVVGRTFDALLADHPLPGPLPCDPTGPAIVAYTSGTTSAPKGVVHSHQSIGFEVRQLAAVQAEDRGRPLTVAPVGHFMGMLSAFLLPLCDGTPINLLDAWEPGRVLELMSSHQVSLIGGAPYFVTSLLEHPSFTPRHLPQMRYAGLGGAPVPRTVVERLAEQGITVFRSYGSTEHPSVTASQPHDDADTRLYTDGRPLTGVELRLAEDGEILTRGPDLCIGYTNEELTRQAFDAQGWYRTGDIGVLDEHGCLSITDRKSDLIIRGGENVSAAEVEEVLRSFPRLADVAVVAVPDAALGERAGAVVQMVPGAPHPTLEAVRAHCERSSLSRQKWPEYIIPSEVLARTATGKLRKQHIREQALHWLASQ
ncbi:AMP-binding protein [Mycobacterium sp. EPa45]|uniref:AMP-binding protein n=1 Tax=Mycobacterium sp. EPa45 TaxID=1545728 RepID=UPI0006423220|nr:AMP-binding protein [Mycobacterium sp. EPa45]AKK25469.1 AMP-dependent synthetase [Mycobacterium sp. EPa45]